MLLYITRKFPPSVGGMQRFNEKLVTNLKKIDELALISWGGEQWILPFFYVGAFFRSLWICMTKPISCIYVSDGVLSPLGWLLKIFTGKRVVANIHGRDIAFSMPIYQMIIPWCLRRLNKILCVSSTLKEECIKRKIPENILYVIPNGVDVDDFNQPVTEEQRLALAEIIPVDLTDKRILITVGRLVPKKGVASFVKNTLPKIISKNDDVVYLIVGDGPDKDKIQSAIIDNNLDKHAFLIGAVPMDGGLLPALYQMADVFVMPNVAVNDDMEGFGIVAVEAGAAALPLVASRVDGIIEAVHNNCNGYLIDPGQYDAFAFMVCELLSNNEMHQKTSTKSRQYVKDHFGWPSIAKRYSFHFNN